MTDFGDDFDTRVELGHSDQEIADFYSSEGKEEMIVALARVSRRKQKENDPADVEVNVFNEAFEQLDLLAKSELDKAAELLTMVKQSAPHANIDNDLDSLAGLTRKAMLRQRVGHAYVWAKQHLKAFWDQKTTDEEDSYACRNHPTERS